MNSTIWKFEIEVSDFVELEIPEDSTFLDVQVQDGKVVLWYMVRNPDGPTRTTKFRIYGTGHTLDDENQYYRGTFQLLDGAFVGHLFERNYQGG